MDSDALLTVDEAAQQLGISKYQVYRRIMRGDLPAMQGRRGNVHYLIPQAAVCDYIAAGGADVLSPPRPENADALRVSEVAILTGYSAETIRRMCREGRLPYLKGVGSKGHYRIPREHVEGLLAGE